MKSGQEKTIPSFAAAGGDKYESLRRLVYKKIERLQNDYLAGRPGSAGRLARLRRALTTEPGAQPDVWQETLEGVTPEATRDEPTPEEYAVHSAITLYALHQQSQSAPMHVRDISLGHASRRLARVVGGVQADAPGVLRRFHAIGTAEGFTEVIHHSRGLVTRLRSEGIPLDYGLFAKHLLWLQIPGQEHRVRLSWGRDYYALTESSDETDLGE